MFSRFYTPCWPVGRRQNENMMRRWASDCHGQSDAHQVLPLPQFTLQQSPPSHIYLSATEKEQLEWLLPLWDDKYAFRVIGMLLMLLHDFPLSTFSSFSSLKTAIDAFSLQLVSRLAKWKWSVCQCRCHWLFRRFLYRGLLRNMKRTTSGWVAPHVRPAFISID